MQNNSNHLVQFAGACPGGRGLRGLPPPLFSQKNHCICYFLSWAPPPLEILKSKKKAFRFLAAPPYKFLDTSLIYAKLFACICNLAMFLKQT